MDGEAITDPMMGINQSISWSSTAIQASRHYWFLFFLHFRQNGHFRFNILLLSSWLLPVGTMERIFKLLNNNL
jgi:hypothetical protein